jgi:hypothetical protein
MMVDYLDLIEKNLLMVATELDEQGSGLSEHFPPEVMSFKDEITQIYEFINVAGEYGLAYESLIALLEDVPFILSGKAIVKLVEVAIIMGYKTHREEDAMFDRRYIEK